MQTIQVKNGQSLFDIAVQYCGKADAVLDIIKLNNLSFTSTLTEGQKLIVPGMVNLKVAKEFLIEGVSPANDVNVEPWDVVLITDTYEVLRTFEVNFSNEYCSGSAINKFETITDAIFIKDISNTLMDGVILAANTQFDSANCTIMPDGDYIRDSYLMRSGMSVSSDLNPRIKLLGLDPSKFYQFYIIAGNDDPDNVLKIKVGSATTTRVTTGNYPYAINGDIYVNPAVIRFKNILPNADGEIYIEFEKVGSYWFQVAINYLIVEETNEMKV